MGGCVDGEQYCTTVQWGALISRHCMGSNMTYQFTSVVKLWRSCSMGYSDSFALNVMGLQRLLEYRGMRSRMYLCMCC